MHVVEHTLHGLDSVDVIGCDNCRVVLPAASTAGWLHLGPLIVSKMPRHESVDGFDFCSLACAAEQLTRLAAGLTTPAARA